MRNYTLLKICAYAAIGAAVILGAPGCGNTSVEKPSKSKVSKRKRKKKSTKNLEKRIEESKKVEEPVKQPIIEPPKPITSTLNELAMKLCKSNVFDEKQKHIKLGGGYVANLSKTAKFFEVTFAYKPALDIKQDVDYKFTMIYDLDATVKGKKFGLLRCAFDAQLFEEDGLYPECAIFNDFRANGILERDQHGNDIDNGYLKDFKGATRKIRKDQFVAMIENLPEILQRYIKKIEIAEKESDPVKRNDLVEEAKLYMFKDYHNRFKRKIPK